MTRSRKDQPSLFDAVDAPLFLEQTLDGSPLVEDETHFERYGLTIAVGEDDGRYWIGSRCTIGGEEARVKSAGAIAYIEPVSLDVEPLYVEWDEVCEAFEYADDVPDFPPVDRS
jgi:hypothetical protein